MIVWIEGPDGAGKTTLANMLIDNYGYNTVPLCQRLSNKYKELDWWKSFTDEYKDAGTTLVEDRSPVSEIVYRLYDNDEPWCNLVEFAKIISGTKIIYCKNKNAFYKAIARGEDNIVSKKDHDFITTMYEFVISLLKKFGNVKIFEYEVGVTETRDILKFINRR